MTINTPVAIALGLVLTAATGMFLVTPRDARQKMIGAVSKNTLPVTLLQAPLYFEPNRGQAPEGVLYQSRGAGYDVRLDAKGATLALRANASESARSVRMTLRGANDAAEVTAEEPLTGVVNYLNSPDERKWRRNIPTFGRVRYRGVYDGIDQVFYGNQRQLEYDFIVAPGADPSVIRTAFDGASTLEINEAGDLVISLGESSIRQLRPVIYQQVADARVAVDGAYRIVGAAEVTIDVGAYDRRHPLVIDPILDPNLQWATLLGGGGDDDARHIAVHNGTVIVAGTTTSAMFPSGAPQTDLRLDDDTFQPVMYVARFDENGTHLTTSYLASQTGPQGMDVDAAGNIYLVGQTNSSFLPTTSNAFLREQPTLMFGIGTGLDGFLMKLNPDASALLYSSYVGASPSVSKSLLSITKIYKGWSINPGNDAVTAVAVDDAGNAYITGYTDSDAFPATNNAVATGLHKALLVFEVRDGFAMKIDTKREGIDSIRYSTFIGGTCTDGGGTAIAINAAGDMYVAGQHTSGPLCSDIGTTPGVVHPNPLGGGKDGYVMKIDPDLANSLEWATYVGGGFNDNVTGLGRDPAGNLYVALHDEGQNRARIVSLSSNGQTERWSHSPGSTKSSLYVQNNPSTAFVFATVSLHDEIGYVRYTMDGLPFAETILDHVGATTPAGIAADYRHVYVAGQTTVLPAFSMPGGALPLGTNAFLGKWIHHPPPTLTIKPTPPTQEGMTLSNVLLAEFSGADSAFGPFGTAVEWGDGAKSTGVRSISANGTGTVIGTHRYPDDGLFPVGICIHQQDDESPTCVQNTIAVANVPPTVFPAAAAVDASTPFAQFIGKTNGSVEVVLSRSASVSDPGVNDTHTGTIAWGDGAIDPVIVIPSNREFAPARHTYSAGGTKNIQVCATDDHDTRCANFNLVVPVADLQVTRTAVNATECTPFSYTITVRNNSSLAVQNVILTDKLADNDVIRRKLAYLSVLSVSGSGLPIGTELTADAAEYEFQRGTHVAIDETGTTVIVVGKKYGSGPPVQNFDRAEIYERDPATLAWRRVQVIDQPRPHASTFIEPAINGRFLALASPDKLRVYEKIDGIWAIEPMATLPATSEVAMGRNTIVVGRKIYELIDGVWTARTLHDGDFDAFAVSADGTAVVVGDSTTAYVYTKTPTGWSAPKPVTLPAGPRMSLAINGDRLVMGSFLSNVGSVPTAGQVYIFRKSGTNWVQEAVLVSPAPTHDGRFGAVLAFDGSLLAAGEAHFAPGDPHPRLRHVFARNGITWNHVATLADATSPGGAPPMGIGGGTIVTGEPNAPPDSDDDALPGANFSLHAGRVVVYGSAAQADGTLTVNLGTLEANAERTVTIVATAGPDFTADTNAVGTATVAGGAFDPSLANNTSSSTIFIDNTATTCNDATGPILTATVSGTLGNDGWYTSEQVTVEWSANDPESQGTVGMGAECATRVLDDDTLGTTLTCTATSAGGTGSGSVTVKIDHTAPTVTVSAQPAQGAPELVNETDYFVTFQCNDAGSGVQACNPHTAVTASAGTLVTGFATDRAGNRSEALIGLPRAHAGGDQIVEVLANCAAPVHLDGRASIDPGSMGLIYTWTGPFGTLLGGTADVSLSSGEHAITLTVRNGAGVVSSDALVVTVQATQPPMLHNVPGPITVHQTFAGTPAVPIALPTATAACGPVTVSSDAPDTFLVGNTTVTFTAADVAGNVTQATTVVMVVPRINLNVSQAFVTGPVPGPQLGPIAGTTATYRVTLFNSGPAEATGVRITAAIPAGATPVPFESELQTCVDDGQGGTACEPIMMLSLEADCEIEAADFVCHTDVLPAHGTTSFDLQLAISSSQTGQIFSTVEATARQQDLDDSNNERTDFFLVRRVATLTLARSFATTTLVAGTAAEYSVTVSNTGPSDATNVQLSETLPFAMPYRQAPAGCTTAGTTLSCHLMSLGTGQSLTIGPFTFESDPATMAGSGVVAGSATAAEMTGAATSSTNLTLTVQVDASVALAAADEPVAGETFVLTATAFNSGPSTARELTITIEAPAALASFGTGGPCVPSTVGAQSIAECRFPRLAPPGAMAPSGPMPFGIPVLVKPSARGSVPFNARIVTAHDTDSANDIAAVAVNVLAHVDLGMSMTAAPDPAGAGEHITYSLRLANDGPSDGRGARIDMALPSNAIFVSAVGCVENGGAVLCNGGDLAAGAEGEFTVTLRTDQFARGSITATATASSGAADPSESDPDPSDNTATTIVGLRAKSDLSAAVSADTPAPIAGGSVTFTIRGHNAGPSGVRNASLSLTVPAGVSVPAPPSGCTLAGPTLTCQLADLASGADRSISVPSVVDPFARDRADASVRIAAMEDHTDGDATNNSAAAAIAPVVDMDLSIHASDSADPATAGLSVSYTLRAINVGPSGALNVSSAFELGEGMSFEVASAGCTHANGVVTCSAGRINPDGSASWTIGAHVDQFRRAGLESRAQVTSTDPDRDAGNNAATETTAVTTSSDLSVALVDTPDPAVAGTFLTYTATVENAGPSGAESVSLNDVMPANVMFVRSDPAGCTVTQEVLSCAIGQLGAGEHTSVRLVVVPMAAARVVNTVDVTAAENDPDPANNSATTDTNVSGAAGGHAGAGDFDGDGDLDLAVADEKTDRVKILRNNGHGVFTQIQQVPVGRKPQALAIGDLDGDGDLDIATVNQQSNDLSVITNNGHARFAETARPDLSGKHPLALALGDMDANGTLDIVVALNDADGISWLTRDAAGAWTERNAGRGSAGFRASTHPGAIALGDIDGDGDLDIALATKILGRIRLLTNNGNGVFNQGATLWVQWSLLIEAVSFGDLDLDGDLDLAAVSRIFPRVAVARNDGVGGFTHLDSAAVGRRPEALALADFTGDGSLDAVTANRNDNSVSLLVNVAGTFPDDQVSESPAGQKPTALVVGDVNGDGTLDLVVVNAQAIVTVLLNLTP